MPTRLVPNSVLPRPALPRGNSVWAIVLAGGEGTRLRSARRADPSRRASEAVRGAHRRAIAPAQTARSRRPRRAARANRRREDAGARALLPRRILRPRRAHGARPASGSRHRRRHPPARALDRVAGPRRDRRGLSVRSLRRRRRGLHAPRRVARFRSSTATRSSSCSSAPRRTRPRPATAGSSRDLALETGASGEIRTVHRFVEKPSPARGARVPRNGGLWNTFVMVGPRVDPRRRDGAPCPSWTSGSRRSALRRTLHPRRGPSTAPIASPDRRTSRRRSSRPSPARLAVSRLPPMAWSDWGTPERVIETLRREGIAPAGCTSWRRRPEPRRFSRTTAVLRRRQVRVRMSRYRSATNLMRSPCVSMSLSAYDLWRLSGERHSIRPGGGP